MDLRLTPDLIEIRERSRSFCDEWLIPFEAETEEAGSLSMESYGRIRQAVLETRLTQGLLTGRPALVLSRAGGDAVGDGENRHADGHAAIMARAILPG